jgi:heme oxygenase
VPAVPFSAVLRDATRDQHRQAENSPFVRALLGGRLGVEAYARYAEQLWFVYRALEGVAAGRLVDDPSAGPFVSLSLGPRLRRLPELERDLGHLYGPQWRGRLTALPATRAYADRVRETAVCWPAGYVAHHYTRYLGDLSGGQAIRTAAERAWGFRLRGDGVRFYVFAALGGRAAAFRGEYRALLDALPVDDAERERVVEECRAAFALNAGVFAELAGEFPPGV